MLNQVACTIVATSLLALAGCQGGGGTSRSGAHVASGDASKSAASLATFKALEGEWDVIGDDGKRGPGLVIAMSSGGSAVREIMFPGSGHQMTNMYHADGGTLVLTHYCSMGNQPRMRAAIPADGKTFDFKFDSVTNLREKGEMYMGSMVLTIVDANTIQQNWNHFTLTGGKAPEPTNITFKRKGT